MSDLDRFNTNGKFCACCFAWGWGRPPDWRQEPERKVDASGAATWGGDAYRPCDRSQVYQYNVIEVKGFLVVFWEFLMSSVLFWGEHARLEGPAMKQSRPFNLHRY